MNSGPLVFLGTFFALSLSWLGFVLAPQLQIGDQPPVLLEAPSQYYPSMREGMARQGEQIYRANGCYYCHSQQVRPKGLGGDIARGWGGRSGKVQSVDQDYLYDRPVMLGDQRVGPDLTNIGLRQTNEVFILLHLYDPQLTMQKSVMPPYRYLFEKRKLKFGEKPSDDALPVANLAAGYEVVPTDDARALAAYLISLHSDSVLFEAPPVKTTNAPPAATSTNAAPATNAPPAAGATNQPVTPPAK
jgi:cytochrome c oxidase cbb3-type subunit II